MKGRKKDKDGMGGREEKNKEVKKMRKKTKK